VGGLSTPQLLFELARGGMGSVHLARLAGIGDFERFVVVKRILDVGADASVVERFLSEARVAARIHHANVVGTHHVGVDEQGLYMVLDYIEGGSLASLSNRAVLRGKRIPIPLVLRIALDALAGLGAVHAATDTDGTPLGIIHRDVSLQNVLVGRDGIARLADFGIAKSALTASSTKTGSLVGKLLYLPPEYIRNETTDQTVDIYMLGVTLWCAITGQEPWSAADEAQMMHQILTQPLPSLAASLGEPVAPQVEALIHKACHPVAAERFLSAQQMTLAIDALGRERGWVASQHDVAVFVEELLGVDLGRRRERIAQVLARGNSFPGPGGSGEDATQATGIAEEGGASARRTAWALVALALVAGGLVYLTLGRASVNATASELKPVSVEAPTQPGEVAPVIPASNPDEPSATVVEAEVPVVATSKPEAQTPAPVKSPASRVAAGSTAPQAAVPAATSRPLRAEPRPPTGGDPLSPPAAPDQISSHNPYR
jgi:serine/threonine-protein kinase